MTCPPVGPATARQLVDDYEALRHDVAARQVARDVVRLSGPDAVSYLQGQCSQDVEALSPGASADALLLSPQGKLEALVRVTRTGDAELLLDTDGGFGKAVTDRLERFKLRVKVAIEPLDWRCVALRGPATAARFAQAESGPLALRFSWNGVDGVDLLGAAPTIPEGVRSCSAEAWEALRVEAGIPAMGAELDERTIAAEADLLERCVSFTKGCYTGQELVARLDARGNKVARRLRGLLFEPTGAGHGVAAPTPGRGAALSAGAAVERHGKAVGSVTSSAWSPGVGAVVALAYVHRDVPPGDSVEVAGRDGARVAATVATLPLEVSRAA